MAQKRIAKKIELLVEDYVRELKADHVPIHAVYVFGSRATGRAKPWSDIDVCVISNKFRNPHAALQYLWSKKQVRHVALEPVGYHPKHFNEFESPLVAEIKRTGIRIQ